jgi:hypothetical protein
MTEAEWLQSDEPWDMLEFLRGSSGMKRKRRLLACACCRLVWDQLSTDAWRIAVEVAERTVDAAATSHELRAAAEAAKNSSAEMWDFRPNQAAAFATHYDVSHSNTLAVVLHISILDGGHRTGALIRDLFNPFRTGQLDSHWLTSNVIDLAKTIYDDRAFDRLPILADALMDAGCSDEQILNHCRSDGPHVRGCWVVDRILGKE